MPFNPLKCVYGKYVVPQRYVLCFMAFMAIFNAYCMRVCFNMALPEMVHPVEAKNNTTSTSKIDFCPENKADQIKVKGGTYNWSQEIQSNLLGAFFPGYVITHIPAGFLSDTLGGKHVLSLGILISAILSALTPLIIYVGDWWLLMVSRFLIGLTQGFLFPSVTTLLAKWVPKRERSTLGTLVLTGPQVGSIFGNLISAYLMGIFGNWHIVFYFWAVSSIIWYVCFLFMCFSEPSQHPFLPEREAEMLAREIGETPKLKVPWMKLIFYPASLALMAGQVGHGAVFFLMVTDLPKYMKDVLKFNIKQNGVLNALPYLALWICGGISGVISDILINKDLVSIVFIRKLYTTIASVGPSVCCVLAVYLGCNRIAAAAMFILGMFLMGPFYPGMRVNALDLTKNFAGVLTAFVNGMGALAFVPVQYAIGLILKSDPSIASWRLIFWIIFIICSVTNVIYIIWARGDRAEWDKVEEQQE